MVKPDTELAPRKIGRMDAGRSAVALVLLALVFAAWYFVLPAIQARILPTTAGGTAGTWIIRPIIAFRFGACAIASAASMPFLLRRLRDRWNAEDAAVGTQHDPFHGRSVRKAEFMFKSSVLCLIYASALLFYLLSWAVVGPAGIEERLVWGRRHHKFDQITSLETIPGGMRSNALAQNGPWYTVQFADGHSFTFSHDNEGCSEAELSSIATFIAEQSRQTWKLRDDAGPL